MGNAAPHTTSAYGAGVPSEPHATLLAESTRNDVVECRFRGAVVVLSPDGAVELGVGMPEEPIYGRSCNKPMQGAAMVALGLDLPVDLLAMVVASHSGEQRHLSQVHRLLDLGGFSPSDLQNTVFPPMSEAARADMYRRGYEPTRLTSDCSGKHAGMLLTCLHQHWPTDNYMCADHPLQVAIAETITTLSGETPAFVGVDGCGTPAHGLSLVALARAFSTLARSGGVIATCITTHPGLVGGEGRPVTLLMEAMPELMAKDGADGVLVAALPNGRAVAVKVADGAIAPRVPILLAALESTGVNVDRAAHLRSVPVMGGGQPVGETRAVKFV